MPNEDLTQQEIVKRLDIIINLLLNHAGNPENQVSTSNRIKYLKSMGLAEIEIGKVVGKATNYVHAVLSREKKGRKKSG